MLEKFVSIANVGRFRDYSAGGDVSFRKLTVIFGENGRGKSTITSIIRSLQTGDGNHINERRTLPSMGTPSVKVRLQGAITNFRDGAWTTRLPEIEVFDAQFINDNIYSGLEVDHNHKRNLYRIIVGEQGVTLSKLVDDLDEKIRKANAEVNETKKKVKEEIAGNLDIERFVALEKVDNIDELIAMKEKEIAAIENALEIATKESFALLKLPAAPQTDILSTTLDDLSEHAAAAVAAHVKTLGNGRGEAWLANGLDFMTGETCPFCAQEITGLDLVKAFKTYFGLEYDELKDEITKQAKANDDNFGPNALLSLQHNISKNSTLEKFWKQFFDVMIVDLPIHDLEFAFRSLHAAFTDCLDEKVATPLEDVAVTPELTMALATYREILERGTAYNAACKAMNEKISRIKSNAAIANVQAATSDLVKFKNTKRRFDPAVEDLCKQFDLQKQRKEKLEIEKKEAKVNLEKHSETIFSIYEGTMNQHLRLFGAEFQLSNTSGKYLGGKPNSSYNIKINSVPVNVDTVVGSPSFKSALSGGDKSCLALAFFLARLAHDPRLGEKVVVFDDPMCSLDRFRSDRTVKAIVELVGRAKQVIVLSHDFYLLRRIWDGVVPADRTALYVHRVGTTDSTVAEWDIVSATRSEYLQDYFALEKFLADGPTGDLRDLARKIRVLLEENLRMRFPDVFGSGQWLGDFLQAIRESQDGAVVYPMRKHLERLDAINDYSKKYHHAHNPNAATEPIGEAELAVYARETLEILRGQP